MKAKLQGDKILNKTERKALTKLGYFCDHKRAHKFFSLLSQQDIKRRKKEGTWGNPDYGFNAVILKSHGHVVATCQNTKIPYKTVAEVCTDKVTVYEGDDVDGALAAIDGFMAVEKAKRVLNPEHYERVLDEMDTPFTMAGIQAASKSLHQVVMAGQQMGKSFSMMGKLIGDIASGLGVPPGTLMTVANNGMVKPAQPGEKVVGIAVDVQGPSMKGIVAKVDHSNPTDGFPTTTIEMVSYPHVKLEHKPVNFIFADELDPPKDEQP